MTVTLIGVRKVAEFSWTDAVKGDTVTILATNSDDSSDKSRRSVKNSGHTTVSYPLDYTGSSDIQVVGSDDGTDTGTITV